MFAVLGLQTAESVVPSIYSPSDFQVTRAVHRPIVQRLVDWHVCGKVI